MFIKPRPRLAVFACWIRAHHEDEPLTYIDTIEGDRRGELIEVEVTDPLTLRCVTCGRQIYLGENRPELDATPANRSHNVEAGLRSLIGPEYLEASNVAGDRRIRRVGGWGDRVDLLDPPAEDRRDHELTEPGAGAYSNGARK